MALKPVNSPIILVMGVSGCGKTNLGRLLARKLKLRFVDADDHHSQANKNAMQAGHALTDADRQPWLHTLALILDRAKEEGSGVVLACSALKKSYRDYLCFPSAGRALLHLVAAEAELQTRLANRKDHFAGPALLASQLATLEKPESSYEVHSGGSHQETLAAALRCLKRQEVL